MTTIKAHFDGQVLVLEQPVELPTNCILEVVVRPVAQQHHPQQRTLDLLEQWEREDETLSPERDAQNERVYDEIESNGIARTQL